MDSTVFSESSLDVYFCKPDELQDFNTAGRNILGAIQYCVDPDKLSNGELGVELRLPMTTDKAAEFAEVWTTSHPVQVGEYHGIHYAHDGEYLLCTCRIPPSSRYAKNTESAYVAALDVIHGLGYEKLFRMWNYIGGINQENADGMEIYRDFCVGRSTAFEICGLPPGQLCAATGIGALDHGISFYSLSLKSGTCTHLDNPRQLSAYRYPPRYGPRSPCFARATHVRPADKATAEPRLYVSGTSSIVGHETVHRGDIDSQCHTALENIRFLIATDNTARYGLARGYRLSDLNQIKVYVRHAEHIELVRSICSGVFSPRAEIAYMNVDICRPDLLVEIEGVVRPSGSTAEQRS